MIHDLTFHYWEFANKDPIAGVLMFGGMLSFFSYIISRTLSTIASFGPAGKAPQIIQCSCACHEDDEEEDGDEDDEE